MEFAMSYFHAVLKENSAVLAPNSSDHSKLGTNFKNYHDRLLYVHISHAIILTSSHETHCYMVQIIQISLFTKHGFGLRKSHILNTKPMDLSAPYLK